MKAHPKEPAATLQRLLLWSETFPGKTGAEMRCWIRDELLEHTMTKPQPAARRAGKSPLRAPGFALLVIGLNGEEDYLCNGMGDTPTRFFSKREAQSQKDFMWIGMDGDVQSINIVPYPKEQRE
jgi:hypothetical protein